MLTASLTPEVIAERFETAKRLRKQIRGHISLYPLDFLKNEKLDSSNSIEKLLPEKVFQ